MWSFMKGLPNTLVIVSVCISLVHVHKARAAFPRYPNCDNITSIADRLASLQQDPYQLPYRSVVLIISIKGID